VIKQLVSSGRDTDAIGLAYGALGPGEEIEAGGAEEVVAVVLEGDVGARAGDAELGRTPPRSGPFGELGHAVYAPPGTPLGLVAGEAGAVVAIASAPPDGGEPGPARIIGPDAQHVATVGAGNWERSVRTILGPEDAAARLLIGETINPPGNWSSYPPHKHDEHAPPDEVRLEEVYLFRVDPGGGFGVQLRYEPGAENTCIVRDGDVVVIRRGYHPVVAAPGYELYYLWVMAGEGRQMAPRFDPQHAWVQERGA
jgi:5-deoxy-glucuronate isomerase